MTKDLKEQMRAKQQEIKAMLDEHGIVKLNRFDEFKALDEELRILRLSRREVRRRNALNRLKVADLREILKVRGLTQTGKKSELIDRIREDDTSPATEEE